MPEDRESEDYRRIRAEVQRVCSDFPDRYWRELDRNQEFPWAFYRALAAGGWIGIAIPERYGGGGRGISEACVVLQEVAASGAAMNGCNAIHLTMFGMNTVVRFGSEEMRQRYLPAVAQGDLHVAFGVTEPEAGTDTTSITTFARRDGDLYVVRGRKIWMTKASMSQKTLLLVRTTPIDQVQKRSDGLTLLLADLDSPQVQIRPMPKAGTNTAASCEVIFDDLPVAVSDRVGEEGEGFRYLLHGLNAERIFVAAEAVGIGQAAIRRAVAYANDRVIHGAPIGSNQGVAFPLAESYARLRAADLVAREAAWRYDHDLPCGEHANMAKWLGADAGFAAADQAMQTHGGFGYSVEHDVERYWREARLLRIAPVPQELVLCYLAEHVLGLPRSYGRGRDDPVMAAGYRSADDDSQPPA